VSTISKTFRPDRYIATYSVEEAHDRMRLDQFLLIYMTSFSREQIKEKIKDGHALILGRPGKHRPNTKVQYGDTVELTIHKTIHEDEYWRGEKIKFVEEPEILYEDEDIYILSKPPYMATHPTGKHLFYCATVYLETLNQKTVHSVHRLDRETSGVLLLGKNPAASNKLTVAFEEDQVKKCYFFIGKINEEFKGELTIDAHERLDGGGEGRMRVYINAHPKDSTEGKRAYTHFKILHQENGYVTGLAFPQTGRQHQIRKHAQVHGFPLVGDKQYLGGYPLFQRFKDNLTTPEDHDLMEISRHALHAIALNFPYKGERRTQSSPIPHDLKNWLIDKMTLDLDDFQKQCDDLIEDYFKTLIK
tara:strand:- start:155562 stop:156641 length:1080 start_codon:yes stop_codon:yes gene_type:complete